MRGTDAGDLYSASLPCSRFVMLPLVFPGVVIESHRNAWSGRFYRVEFV
jgi:hypothetical protein